MKKILSITLKHMPDDYPDTSWLGEFGNRAKSDYAIEHKGERNDYPYFNPNWENYKGLPEEEIRKYCQQDYDRMVSLCNGNWYFMGIICEATVTLTDSDLIQTISSGGLWGIESDSAGDYIPSVENYQMEELHKELAALGFKHKAIVKAFKDMKREPD